MARAQKVLSIEVGYSLTQVCEMDFQAKKPKVYGVFSMKTPEGILNDGYIRVTDEYVRDLKSYIAANGMTAKNVIFAVTSTKIANREAAIPAIKRNKVADLIMSNITDYFPVDPTMYQFAHTIMDTVTDETGNKQYRVMVMASPSDILEGYYELAKLLDLNLVSIDYSGNSIFQALRSRVANGVNLTVKIDERSSLITVTNNGVITMQRSGIYGADQIVDIMMDTDIYGERLTYEAAVKTLRRNNMVMREEELAILEEKEMEAAELDRAHREAVTMAEITGDSSGVAQAATAARQADANIKMMRLRKDVTGAYEQLINSIVRVIDYYNSKNRDAAIDNIIITGMAADFWGFSDMLSGELGKNVEVLRNLMGMGAEVGQGLHLQDVSLGDYITVIGAGLGSVGFMPASAVVEGKAKKTKSSASLSNDKLGLVLGVVGVIAFIGVGIYFVPSYFGASAENANLKEKKAQLAPVQDTYNQYMTVKTDYDYISTVYAETENNNSTMREMFAMLEKILPASVEIESFTANASTVTIAMRVDTKKEAASVAIKLREYEDFSDVQITSINVDEDTETHEEYVELSAVCTYGFNPAYAVEEEAAVETEATATEAENVTE